MFERPASFNHRYYLLQSQFCIMVSSSDRLHPVWDQEHFLEPVYMNSNRFWCLYYLSFIESSDRMSADTRSFPGLYSSYKSSIYNWKNNLFKESCVCETLFGTIVISGLQSASANKELGFLCMQKRQRFFLFLSVFTSIQLESGFLQH